MPRNRQPRTPEQLEQQREYNRRRRQDPEVRAKQKLAAQNYRQSEAGKAKLSAWRKANRDKINASQYKWRAKVGRPNDWLLKKDDPEWRERKRLAMVKYNASEKGRATNKRWKDKNRDKVLGYLRKRRAKASASRPVFTEHLLSSLLQNQVFKLAWDAVPRYATARDDIISDIVLAVLEGKLEVDKISATAKKLASRYHTQLYEFAPLSFREA